MSAQTISQANNLTASNFIELLDLKQVNKSLVPTSSDEQSKATMKTKGKEDEEIGKRKNVTETTRKQSAKPLSGRKEAENESDQATNRRLDKQQASSMENVHKLQDSEQDEAANQMSIALEAPPLPLQANGTMPLKREPTSVNEQHQDFDDELDEELTPNGPDNWDYEEEEDDGRLLRRNNSLETNDTSTSASISNQLIDLNSPMASLQQETSASELDTNLNRRASFVSRFAPGGQQELNGLIGASLPLSGEFRRLRQPGGLKRVVQEALRHNKRKRRRRRRRRGQKQPASAANNQASGGLQQLAHQQKRDTTSLPMALIKSMQTRQGLMSGLSSSGGLQQVQQQQQQASLGPLLKQLTAVNPLKQQLASGSLQLSTAIQRLLANKFGAGQGNQTLRHSGNKLTHHLHNNNNNNNHLTSNLEVDETDGADFSATSATSSNEQQQQLANLLATGQLQQETAGGAVANQQQHQAASEFANDMQNQQQATNYANGVDFHQSQHGADYQSSASNTADRLAELMGQHHWTGSAAAAVQQHQQQSVDIPQHQEDALKLSQLVAAATAAAAAASGQQSTSSASTGGGGGATATSSGASKQLIPIEIIGLDPSVTNSILYGPSNGQQQLRQRQRLAAATTTTSLQDAGELASGQNPAAASELDLQENPQHVYSPASLRQQRQPSMHQQGLETTAANSGDTQSELGDQSTAAAATDEQQPQSGQESGGQEESKAPGNQQHQKGPSSVLHIHHFHHTQPASGGGGGDQQAAPLANTQASAAANEISEQQQQPQQQAESVGGEPQSSSTSEEGNKESSSSDETSNSTTGSGQHEQQQRASRVSKLLRPQTGQSQALGGENPRLVLVSGAPGASGQQETSSGPEEEPDPANQIHHQEEPQTAAMAPQGWPPELGDNRLEAGEPEELNEQQLTPAYPKKMRFVTRNSLRNKQQQQQQQARMVYAPNRMNQSNHSYASGYMQEGAAANYEPSSRFNVHSNSQQSQFKMQRPIVGMRNQQQPATVYYQRVRPDFYANQTASYNDRLAASSNEFLAAGPLLQQQQPSSDPQQALGDATPPDGQNMLMVSYRPTGTLAEGQPLVSNRTFNQQATSNHYAAVNYHNTYTRQLPFNSGAEQPASNQWSMQRQQQQQQRPLAANSTTTMLSRQPQFATTSLATSSKQIPSTNLLKSLLKQPKMNQALLLAQLQASGNNQTNSPYWSSEDERLLAQFNLANSPLGPLKVAQANLVHNNSTASKHPQQQQQQQLLDNLAFLRQLNQTAALNGGVNQQLAQLELGPFQSAASNGHFDQIALLANTSSSSATPSQRLQAGDELALISAQEQATIKQQLQQQQQLKQQQQQQVASLLFNNLGASSNPLLNLKLLNLSGQINGTAPQSINDNLPIGGGGLKGGRFELTSASDRLASKFPVMRNASTSLQSNNVRMTKQFHVPNTSSSNKPGDSIEHVIQITTTTTTPQPSLKTTNSVPLSNNKSPPLSTQQVEVENILDSPHGLSNLALGFIFFVSLTSFVLVLISFLYRRRRRAIGSARCGPAARSMGDLSGNQNGNQSTLNGASLATNGLDGRKSSRCFNNLTQRTKHLMRANFTSGNSSTSNVVAGSTPSSSLKSLHQLDSSLTSNNHQNHSSKSQHHAASSHDNRALLGKVKQRSCSPTSQVTSGGNKKTSSGFVSRTQSRQVWSPHEDHVVGSSNQSKYTCANSSNQNAKLSTFNVSSQHQAATEKYSTPDELQADRMLPHLGGGGGPHPNSDIRTLNTRLQKAAYLQKALGHAPTTSQNQSMIASSKMNSPAAIHQPSKLSSKKQQQQYNRASPASVEMVNGQAKYVNTQAQLKHANL